MQKHMTVETAFVHLVKLVSTVLACEQPLSNDLA